MKIIQAPEWRPLLADLWLCWWHGKFYASALRCGEEGPKKWKLTIYSPNGNMATWWYPSLWLLREQHDLQTVVDHWKMKCQQGAPKWEQKQLIRMFTKMHKNKSNSPMLSKYATVTIERLDGGIWKPPIDRWR